MGAMSDEDIRRQEMGFLTEPVGTIQDYAVSGVDIEYYDNGFTPHVDITIAAARCDLTLAINDSEFSFILNEDGTATLEGTY